MTADYVKVLRIPGLPVGKPRMTQRDKFLPSQAAQRYFAWAGVAQTTGRLLFKTPWTGPVTIGLDVHIPFPKSYSRKKRASLVGKPHTGKPDLKNIVAGMEDALNGIAWEDDSQIWRYLKMMKFWTDGEGVVVLRAFEDELSTELSTETSTKP